MLKAKQLLLKNNIRLKGSPCPAQTIPWFIHPLVEVPSFSNPLLFDVLEAVSAQVHHSDQKSGGRLPQHLISGQWGTFQLCAKLAMCDPVWQQHKKLQFIEHLMCQALGQELPVEEMEAYRSCYFQDHASSKRWSHSAIEVNLTLKFKL